MKKSLIALAVTAATGSAFAQSTTTIYGVIDTGYRSVTAGDNKYNGAANGSNMSNRLGFKGTEDIGGIKAGFDMEGDLVPSDGTASGFKFLRKSTVGLTSGFGELRIGRDYTPTFRVYNVIDVFGYVGVGSAGNILGSHVIAEQLDSGNAIGAQAAQDITGTFTTPDRGTERRTDESGLRASGLTTPRYTFADPNTVRANNSFAYYSPVMNGFSANVMYAPGTNSYNLKKVGEMLGGGVTYAQGPISAAVATQTTKGGTAAAAASFAASSTTANTAITATLGTDDQKWTTNFGAASYDFGVAKAALGYRTDQLDVPGGELKTKATFASVIAPMGPVTLKGSYITKKGELDGESGSMGTQIAIGAVYDLSKRTALYTTYAKLNNKDGFANTVGSAATSAGGRDARGFDIGVRHSF